MMLSFTLLPQRLVLFVAILLLLTLPGLRAAMVINEIHYSPSDKTRPTEFIELLNFSDSPVNLSGWRLTDAVQFTFPSNTLVPAQQTVVIAGTPSSFLTNFGFAPLGPWVGRLRRSGANIQLRDTTGLVVDEVDYRPGFPWPTAARGEGASIELIQPTLDNSLGGSWRSSGYSEGIVSSNSYLALQDPSWRFRKGTNEASIPTNAWRFLSFVEDGSWQTAQAPIGFGDNDDKTDLSKPPWNVPTPMQSNYISLYLRRPFVVPDGPLPTRLRLRVVIEDGCVVWINGREVGRLNMRDKLEKPFDAGLTGRPLGAVAHKAVSGGRPVIQELLVPTRSADLATGTNLIAIHAFNSSLNGLGVSIDCAILGEVADPTPGSPNATQVANAPPQIRQVDHIPLQPAASNSVTITARVTDPDRVGSVMLEYQAVDPGRYIRKSDAAYLTNWISLPMNDEGVSPDLTRGDGLYTAVIPAGVQTHRRLVRYRVVAADLLGASVRVPYPDDPQPNFAYFVYDGVPGWEGAFKPGDAGVQGRVQRFPSDLMRSLPVYHLIANEQDVNRSQYDSGFDGVPMPGALVYDGRVHDHITFHNRGEFSTYVSGKNKWRLHFNNTHELQARDNRGRPYDETWDDINLNGGSAPWIAANRGMAGIEECISFRMYELLGGIAPRTHYLSFRIIDNAVEAANPRATVNDPTMGGSGLGQYSGDLWGLYLATESPDGSFLDERGLPDGSVFKIEGGGNGTGNKKNQGPTHPVTTGDWDAFATASNGSQNEAWWRTNMNMHAYYGFRLASRIVGNVDMRNGWNHYFYHHPAGPWVPIPWDLDMMFVGQTHQSASGAIGQDSSMSVPALNLEKRNRAREMLDLMLSDRSPNGGQVGQLVDEYAQIVNPSGQELTWADVDAAMWNFHPRTAGSPSSHQDSSHKGNFYYSRHTFNAFGGPYTRWLRETNFVGTAEHEDFVRYLLDYMTDTYRGRVAWAAGNGNQLGYGYEYVRSETRETVAADVPAKPTISYSGAAGFPANDLRFGCSDFSGKQASAVQWRLGWIAAPGLSGFSAGDRRRYEVEPFWTSPETSPFTNHVRVPFNIAKPGMTYRARVRHKDANGRWSRWSDPVQFVCTAPDVGVYQRGIVISEIQYHPRAATSAEAALGFLDEDFEYLEIKNVTDAPFDLTSVGFTSGVSFEFPPGSMLPACGYGLVVKNIAAFEQRYGAGRPVFGSYAPGNLRNSGELLALSYGSNTPIHTLTYSDRAPWPMEADGTGRSLELVSPNSRPNPAQPENWTYSRGSLGTPGHSDALTYSLWSTGYPGANDPAADLDGDGKRNVIEYAFVQDPSVATPEPPVTGRIETLSVDGVSRPHLVVRFNSRQDTSDLGYHVEASTDLAVWKETAILESMERVADGTAIQRWRIPFVSGGSTQQFVRVRISICR